MSFLVNSPKMQTLICNGQVVKRQSNLELLRILSMLFVLAIHSDFYSLHPLFPKWFVVLCTDAGVNCFVLISGYFSISPKLKSFISMIFQILFFLIISYFISILFFHEQISLTGLFKSINIINSYWFVNSYIALYAFSPVLNIYSKNVSKKGFMWTLVSFAIVQFVMGYCIDYLKFERGYSFQSFIFLYLLARYLHLYGLPLCKLKKSSLLLLYLAFTACSTLLLCLAENTGKGIGGSYYIRAYNAPLMILSSVSLFILFTKFSIQKKWINWIASSAFAVYLFHASPSIYPYYRKVAHSFFIDFSQMVAIIQTLALMFVVFFIAILLDKTRSVIWRFFVTNK